MNDDIVRVGARQIPIGTASTWIGTYFDTAANQASADPYAYPAYDLFSNNSHPNELNDGELLAAALLIPHFKIRAFMSLQAARPALEAALAAIPTDLALTEAVASGSHRELIYGFTRMLDGEGLPGVQLTTLMKTLHRKRPLFIPLFDEKVKNCYWTKTGQPGYPMNRVPTRKDSEFTTAFVECVASDLAEQPAKWQHLASYAPAGVSTLRLLDVVAWRAGK